MSFGKLLAVVCALVLVCAATVFVLLDPAAVGIRPSTAPSPDCSPAEVERFLAVCGPALYDAGGIINRAVRGARSPRDVTALVAEIEKTRVGLEPLPHPPCADGVHRAALAALASYRDAFRADADGYEPDVVSRRFEEARGAADNLRREVDALSRMIVISGSS